MERVNFKRDLSKNWEKAINFIPKDGELIEYSDLKKFKIGNGKDKINDLPFKLNGEVKLESEILIINTEGG